MCRRVLPAHAAGSVVAKLLAQGLPTPLVSQAWWLLSLLEPAVLGRGIGLGVEGAPQKHPSAGSKRFCPGSGCGTCRHRCFVLRPQTWYHLSAATWALRGAAVTNLTALCLELSCRVCCWSIQMQV